MNNAMLRMYVKFQDLMSREEGQDLVEYALVITIISLAAIATLTSLATRVEAVFTAAAAAL